MNVQGYITLASLIVNVVVLGIFIYCLVRLHRGDR